MDKDYNIDDILQEVQKKKQRESRPAHAEKPTDGTYSNTGKRPVAPEGEPAGGLTPLGSRRRERASAFSNRPQGEELSAKRASVYSLKNQEKKRAAARPAPEETHGFHFTPEGSEKTVSTDSPDEQPFSVTHYEKPQNREWNQHASQDHERPFREKAQDRFLSDDPKRPGDAFSLTEEDVATYLGPKQNLPPRKGPVAKPSRRPDSKPEPDLEVPEKTDAFLFDILPKAEASQDRPGVNETGGPREAPERLSPRKQPPRAEEWARGAQSANRQASYAKEPLREEPFSRAEQDTLEVPALGKKNRFGKSQYQRAQERSGQRVKPESPEILQDDRYGQSINHETNPVKMRPVQPGLPQGRNVRPNNVDDVLADGGQDRARKLPSAPQEDIAKHPFFDTNYYDEPEQPAERPSPTDRPDGGTGTIPRAENFLADIPQKPRPVSSPNVPADEGAGIAMEPDRPVDSAGASPAAAQGHKARRVRRPSRKAETPSTEEMQKPAPAVDIAETKPDSQAQSHSFDDLFSYGAQDQEKDSGTPQFNFEQFLLQDEPGSNRDLSANQPEDSFSGGFASVFMQDADVAGDGLAGEMAQENETLAPPDVRGKRRKGQGKPELDQDVADTLLPGLDQDMFGPNASFRDSRSKDVDNPLKDTRELQSQRRGKWRGKKAAAQPDAAQPPEGQPWKQNYAVQELLAQKTPVEDEFESPDDIRYVAKDIRDTRRKLLFKFVGTIPLAIAVVYLSLAFQIDLNLPEFIFPEEHMRMYLISCLFLFLAAVGLSFSSIASGVASLCKLRANNDTPAALAVIGALTQAVALLVSPVAHNSDRRLMIHIYMGVAVVVLLFNLLGKLMMMFRIERNFIAAVSKKEKYACLQIQNRDFAREFSRGLGPDVDRVAYSVKAGFLPGFLEKSYSPDYSMQFSRLVAPITLIGAVIVAIVTMALDADVLLALSAFAAVLCITAPFSGTVMPNLMLSVASKKLTKERGFLAGYETAEDLSETGAVVLRDRDLFDYNNVMLHGMKVFAEKRIDQAIVDAASVTISCDSVMTGVFMNMIGQNKDLLKPVEGLVYEENMGLSAWVDGKRVLIGNRDLMQMHNIDCPSRDFEAKYTKNGRQALYIVNSGELTAMFVVSYNADPEVSDTLCEMERRGIYPVVYTTDPNITSSLVAETFGLKRTHVKIMPASLHTDYEAITQPKDRVTTGCAHAGGLRSVSRLFFMAQAVKRSVTVGTILQLIGVIVGYGLVAFMAFMGTMSSADCLAVLVYSAACTLATLLASLIARK